MKGGETFKVAIRSMVEVSKFVLAESGFTTADVDWLLPHQANERILRLRPTGSRFRPSAA